MDIANRKLRSASLSGSSWTRRRVVLVVGHPGHELRVHGWLEITRPVVFVLTDGSGHTRRSRLPSTTKLLRRAGARTGSVYGQFTDAEMYGAILAGDATPFIKVARELADAFVAHAVEYVVGDAQEGFNPTHDLCRYLINAAVALHKHETGADLPSYEMALDSSPIARPPFSRGRALRIELNPDRLRRKLDAAAHYHELKDEIDAALARFGPEAFRQELLWPVDPRRDFVAFADPPFYEQYGQKQVEARVYRQVIRHEEHMLPLLERIWTGLGLTPSAQEAAQ
jgi:hypothetical protein